MLDIPPSLIRVRPISTHGDPLVQVLQGEKPGEAEVVVGGTHAKKILCVAATLLVEKAQGLFLPL